ncbi:flagellar protein FlaG [Oxalobacter vibrioformis]|uniref:Flagellar protein FlaG n=1 Tax=Oxalobacter vibrioformis TaxID=933080 RepID=A0A9E9M098_9BURK|nr:flagellar protein FlaG [Oxalobacter vibrioformis]WAW10488.1 flagellar protein FlaG [Oxalobacter vibrioformis]
MDIRTIGNTQTRAAPPEAHISQPVQDASFDAVPVQTVRAVSGVDESQRQLAEASVTVEEAKEIVNSISASLQSISSGLQFQVDEDSGKVIVKMVDKQSGEVLKQIPSEEALRIAQSLSNLTGVLLSEKA